MTAIHRAGYRILRKMRAVLPKGSSSDASRNPMASRMLHWTRANLVPRSRVWVQVERGLAEGLWMRLQLPDEMFLWRGDHEPGVQGILADFLRPAWVAYDVGSYLGFFALAMARAVGSAGHVVAFEPDPENTARLRENVSRNKMETQIQVVNAAAWRPLAGDPVLYRQGGKARSRGGIEADGISPVLASGERILVPCTSLDDFIAQGNPVPQLLKIDVEGGECAVLAGAETLVTKGKPLIICEVHHADAARWIERWLSGRGYRQDWMIPPEQFPRHLVAKAASRAN